MDARALLEEARQARRDGNLPLCTERASESAAQSERERDAETTYHALACVGRLHFSRDEPKEALDWFQQAKEAASAGGLVRWLAGAFHDLFLCMRETGNRVSARRYAGTAFDLYNSFGGGHPYLSALTADMAQCDFEFRPTQDSARHALQAWKACPVSLPEPRVCLIAAANSLWGASVAEMPRAFAKASESLSETLSKLPDMEGAPKALVTASEAYRRMQRYPRAHSLAVLAESLAVERGEGRVKEKAAEARRLALAER